MVFKEKNLSFKINNFDLIRLFAALQVAFHHTVHHLSINNSYILKISKFLSIFPGVPVFFIISGFLISASYERNKNIKQYFLNRFFRIYPALWVGLFFSMFILFYFGFFCKNFINQGLLWFFCQATFFQFYTADFLRSFGVGAVNGSLWTITVEIQFYLLIPILYFFSRKIVRNENLGFILLIILAASVYIFYRKFGETGLHVSATIENLKLDNSFFIKLFHVTIFPHIYLFLLGVFARKYWNFFQRILKGNFFYFIVSYIFLYYFFGDYFVFGTNSPNPLTAILLACLVVSAAYSFPSLSDKCLKGRDLSYGIYIYHMLVVNFVYQMGCFYKLQYLFLALLITIMLASISWYFIEKPFLKRKKKTLHAVK